jgi:hypothetical protein
VINHTFHSTTVSKKEEKNDATYRKLIDWFFRRRNRKEQSERTIYKLEEIELIHMMAKSKL